MIVRPAAGRAWRRLAVGVTAVAALAAVSALGGFGVTAASATPGPSSSGAPGASLAPAAHPVPILPAVPLPAHLVAPYVDVTAVPDLAAASRASGAADLTLAFLQTPTAGSCTVDWAGDTATPVAASTYGAAIDRIRLRGGDVIPSFGGYSADTTGTELADSCTSVPAIAADYERVITTYRVQRLDFDIEAASLDDTAAIQRRNEAIVLVEKWAAEHRRPISFSYTLPSTPQGLAPSGLAVLQSAAAVGARIATVNIMTFDYYDGASHDMAADARTAATALTGQLRSTISPRSSQAALWQQVGITQMIGIDDYGPSETLTVSGATGFIAWARSAGVGTVSFWALERDNGSCVGTKGASLCSGVAQSPWAFTRVFERFARRF
ncbi:chitinase [Frondihabitans australicus]|uniref:Chitinase n=1 Tax=Frondihabitans australicus TaxID=386892 RepID=A0A495IL12_9MICO|nr:chitinase [Frondihabitans australicus]RKR76623.1 chitinase [Frondihabitans australicus]